MTDTRTEIQELIAAKGKYELDTENFEGANAYSFKGRHLPLNTEVMIKIYDVDPGSTTVFQEPRVLGEATRDGFGVDNLVKVVDAELLNDELVLLAMEYISGGSLFSWLQTKPIGQMDAVRITIGILHGVSKLHSIGLLHRDIKPANILVSVKGNILVPKLGDFGSIARIPQDTGFVNASKHSALYVPPEGWDTPSRYFRSSDVYQVGLVLHELTNGLLPTLEVEYLDKVAKAQMKQMEVTSLGQLDDFERTNLVNAAIARCAQSESITSKRPNRLYVSNRLLKIIRVATRANHSDRYESASEFLAALHKLSLPNWIPERTDPETYIAQSWNGYDWKMEAISTEGQLRGVQVYRKRQDLQLYRKWKTFSGFRQASDEVEKI